MIIHFCDVTIGVYDLFMLSSKRRLGAWGPGGHMHISLGQRRMSGSQYQTRSLTRFQPSGFMGKGDSAKGLFSREMGPLQRQLRLGEYDLLKFAPMLESEFLQVSKRGEVIDVHNLVETMTVAVACTNLLQETPDVLLLARPVFPSEEHLPPLKNLLCQYPPPKALELTRLLPLHFVKITIHNQRKRQLRFKLASGRAFYLQLCSQPDQQEDLFELWVKVVDLLHAPSEQRSKIQDMTRDPKEAAAQRPESPSFINLTDTVSIQTVYSFSKAPSPMPEDTTSRRSLSVSLTSQHSTKGPHVSPIIIQEKTSESGSFPPSDDTGSQEALEGAPDHQHLSPIEEVDYESSPRSSRYLRSSCGVEGLGFTLKP
uniref:Uncharacterized protein n=1 Tax=Sphaerodactylus townsendi TaxID=933632 RepID=A0ACB8EUQ7_9SAUR